MPGAAALSCGREGQTPTAVACQPSKGRSSRFSSGRGTPRGIEYRLNFFEPLSAFLGTCPALMPHDVMLTANRAFVSVGVKIWLPHISNSAIDLVPEAAHRRIRPSWFMWRSLIMRDYFEGEAHQTRRSSVMAKKKSKKSKSKGM